MATTYQFAHHRTVDGERCLIWGNGIGEVLIPVDSSEYYEALMDRSWQDNDLADAGEQSMLDVYFRNADNITPFYGRLYNDTPIATDTLASLTGEVTGTGYPGSVSWTANSTDFPTLALDVGNYKVTSTVKTWTAGSAWSVATYLVLASAQTGTSGILVAFAALSASRTLANLDTLDVSVAIKLTGT